MHRAYVKSTYFFAFLPLDAIFVQACIKMEIEFAQANCFHTIVEQLLN